MTRLIDFYHSPTEWSKKTALNDKWYVRGKPFTHTLFHDEGDVATLPPDAKLIAVGDVDDVKKNLLKFYFSDSMKRRMHVVDLVYFGYTWNNYINGTQYTEAVDADKEPLSKDSDLIFVCTDVINDKTWKHECFHPAASGFKDLFGLEPEDCFNLPSGDDFADDEEMDRMRFDNAWPEDLNSDGDKFDEGV